MRDARRVRRNGFLAAFLTMALFGSADAAFILNFEGLQNLEPIENFYAGGTGGNGSGPGPNFGVQFLGDALAIIDADAGGTGNFGGEPSPDTAFFFTSASPVMNVPGGFGGGLSFFYSNANGPTDSVSIFSGLNGTGALLAVLSLPQTPFNGAPDPNGQFSPFVPIGIAFAGIARSVVFGANANNIVFDNVTIGSDLPGAGAFNICIQGGRGGTGSLFLDTTTGDYQFCCDNGATKTGTALLTASGACRIAIRDDGSPDLVLGTIDLCRQVGDASLQMPRPVTQCTIQDSSIASGFCGCPLSG